MNISKLQSFAMDARRQLMSAVQAKLNAVLQPNSSARVDMPNVFSLLEDEIAQHGGSEKGQQYVVEHYAYRWFNRIVAFRYMDVHDYTSPHVVSAMDVTDTVSLPEILSDAKRGEYNANIFSDSDKVSTQLRNNVEGLFNGTVPSDDPQGQAYGLLMQAACHHWNKFMPFMFESSTNADLVDEMLMPADLLAPNSVLRNAVEVITPEDCGVDHDGTSDDSSNVEIIGWLYQFYIAERKDEVMAGFKKSKKAGAAEIPAATQLFTPDWIVRYLVQNTVGRLWMQNHPESELYRQWDYYIPPADGDTQDYLHISSPEELTVCDPACGSGHMLTYAFDVLYSIYEEEGYSPSEIPRLILEHNLFGMEIDERAAMLARFALTMKARERSRRFFRNPVEPHIEQISKVESFTETDVDTLNGHYKVTLSSEEWNLYENADVFGSLIQPSKNLQQLALKAENIEENELSTEHIEGSELISRANTVFQHTRYLARKYTVIVANPPYMGTKNMDAHLKQFVNDNYADGKSDLFSAFMIRNLHFLPENALLGMITMQSWMFLSSFEKFREDLLDNNTIVTMAHLGTGAFDSIGGEVVSTTAFTIQRHAADGTGTYLRLINIQGDNNQANTCKSVLGNNASSETKHLRFIINQKSFIQIPSSPIAYWISNTLRSVFSANPSLATIASPKQGLATGNNDRFLRFWWEVSTDNIGLGMKSRADSRESGRKWFPCNKGGDFRKWYGNQEFVVNWANDGKEVRTFGAENGGRIKSRPQNMQFYFRSGLTWSTLSTGDFAMRVSPEGTLFETKGSVCFPNDTSQTSYLLGLLNSSVVQTILQILSPTIDYHEGPLGKVPIVVTPENYKEISVTSDQSTQTAQRDWDSFEVSDDFQDLEIISERFENTAAHDSTDKTLANTITTYTKYCYRISIAQQTREIKNNELVADAYRVQDEVLCDVPLERVSLKRNSAFVYPNKTQEERDALFATDLVKELISYAVGCMFGRYSIDKPGLILASQSETIDDYYAQVPNPTFKPDLDNVIPITADDYFEDDIVSRFRKFVSVVFGENTLTQNIAYIEQALGKDLRSYFVNDFYADHVKMYKNRPIYWQYSSNSTNRGVFKALMYVHRYTPKTPHIVLGYLRDFVAKIARQAEQLEKSERTQDKRTVEKLRKAIAECRTYEDQILYPLATQNLPMDLDDGVLVNYLRMGDALQKIPAIEKKRKDVQTWTWPHYPLQEAA